MFRCLSSAYAASFRICFQDSHAEIVLRTSVSVKRCKETRKGLMVFRVSGCVIAVLQPSPSRLQDVTVSVLFYSTEDGAGP